MSPISMLITTIAMAVVSACAGAFLFLIGQLELGFSVACGIGVFVLLYALQFHVFVQKTHKQTEVTAKDHSREITHALEQSAALKRQIDVMEKELSAAQKKIQAIVNYQLDEEADKRAVLEARLNQLEELVAQSFAHTTHTSYLPPIETPAPILDMMASEITKISPPKPSASPQKTITKKSSPNFELNTQILAALVADEVELCLAPVVTLPHRRAKFHSASLNVIMPDGLRISTAEFASLGLPDDTFTRADVKLFEKLAVIVPEFRRRTPETAFFVDIQRETLRNGRSFSDLLSIFEANPKIVDQLIVGIANSTLSTLDPLENATLGALRKQNLRFCVNSIKTLRLDMDNWSAMGMRFAAIPACLLHDENQAISSDIVMADVPLLLRRYGVELIVTDIDAESTIVEVLEFDIRYGQGHLFGAPRPVYIAQNATPTQEHVAVGTKAA